MNIELRDGETPVMNRHSPFIFSFKLRCYEL